MTTSADVTLTVTINRKTKRVTLTGPEDPALCLRMLQAGTSQLFGAVLSDKQKPERKVRTLDELGVSRGARVG